MVWNDFRNGLFLTAILLLSPLFSAITNDVFSWSSASTRIIIWDNTVFFAHYITPVWLVFFIDNTNCHFVVWLILRSPWRWKVTAYHSNWSFIIDLVIVVFFGWPAGSHEQAQNDNYLVQFPSRQMICYSNYISIEIEWRNEKKKKFHWLN